ncbi:MAG: phosphoribosylamine--glycine ligase, partial [Nitrospirota bacterium]|nr:phosphoribosylamine--glycine ligase [Nitrospirota bacterium]
MKVLVVGGGGREHALCWKLRQSAELGELYCAPGNPGTATIARNVSVAADEIQRLADLAADLKIDLTVVGPELSLALGIVDEFQERGLRIFGPHQRAAQLESSKVFAKEFMARHQIPTAPFQVVHTAKEARRAVKEIGLPAVLKADGLAAGKGVLIVRERSELRPALDVFFSERRFGGAGDRVVVEACLEGEEVSLIALSDGRRLLALAPAKDYKRVGVGDQGPNTGGMGSHSPSGVLGSAEAAEVLERVMWPVIEQMAGENQPFVGFLYAGLILTQEGPRVLEFNVRLGDPEAQSVLLRLEDDLLPVRVAGAERRFDLPRLRFRREAAACVVLASR